MIYSHEFMHKLSKCKRDLLRRLINKIRGMRATRHIWEGWNGCQFCYLIPIDDSVTTHGNDLSCVLLIPSFLRDGHIPSTPQIRVTKFLSIKNGERNGEHPEAGDEHEYFEDDIVNYTRHPVVRLDNNLFFLCLEGDLNAFKFSSATNGILESFS